MDEHRISVLQVSDTIGEDRDGSEYVADQLDITLAEVHAALSYYEHPEGMSAIREHHRNLEAQSRSESSVPSTIEQ